MNKTRINPNYPDNWDEIRKDVLERDGYKCSNDPTHSTRKLHVHHIVPISQGGTHNLSNLKTLCEECHKKVHPFMEDDLLAEEGVEFIESSFMDIDIDNITIHQDVVNDLKKRINESSVAQREALQDYNFKADEFQEIVMGADEHTIRILAPAGSGKTQTIINRVLMNVQRGMNPKKILILTFDNSAVSSILDKMHNELDKIGAYIESPEIRTLNSFGYSILREQFPHEFKPIAENYRRRRLFTEVKEGLGLKRKDILDALSQKLEDNFFLEFFSFLKNQIFDPRNIDSQKLANFMLSRDEAEPFFSSASSHDVIKKIIQGVIWLYKAYEIVLKRENLIEYDDQKLRAYICLINNSVILNNLQGLYTEIIVDEFQDINTLDFELIKLISKKARLVVTGDDDQAIYGFRGCTPEYILRLDSHLDRPVTTYYLRKNYRSPRNIVYHSTALIRHNTFREEKDPIAADEGMAAIKIIPTLSSDIEAKLIVEYISKIRRENNNLDFNNFAILYRTNSQSLPLQIEFILNDIPYYVRREDNILANEVLEKLLGLLRLKIAIHDRTLPKPTDAVLAVKAYFRYINSEQNAGLLELFTKQPNFKQAITSEQFYKILEKARQSQFNASILKAFEASTLMNTLDVISTFNGLRGLVGSLEDVISEQVPLGEIYNIAASFKGDLKEFVKTIERALERAKEINAGNNKEIGVGLLTYFRSKGLQWHTVILTSCNEGIIPHKKAQIEDERRLFYVALTRAQSNLLISYVKMVCGNIVNPSRFIEEAGLPSK